MLRYELTAVRHFLREEIEISKKLVANNMQRTSIATKVDLIRYFMSDIKLTESLLGRDLSDWYK